MTDWVLILTIFSYRGGGSIDHITFASEKDCMSAAQFWLDKSAPKLGNDYFDFTAICTQRTAPGKT